MNSPTQLQFNRRIIIENIAALFSGSAIAQGLNAITLLLIARQLGPENYGQYTSSLVFATFCSIVFSLGLDLWLLHEGGKAPSKIANLVGSAFSVKLTIGLVWLVVMFIVSIFIKSSALPTDLVRISAITVFISSLYGTLLTAFKALLRAGVIPDDPQALELIIIREKQASDDKFITTQLKFDPQHPGQGDIVLFPEDIVILPASSSRVVM